MTDELGETPYFELLRSLIGLSEPDPLFPETLELLGYKIDFDRNEFLAPSGRRLRGMMRSYQRYLSNCIYGMPGLLGAAEMSLGKTGATLDGVKRILLKNPSYRCIIVGPLEVVKNTWPDEIDEWEHLHDLTYSVVTGTEKQRKAALAVDAQITLINRENLQWLWKTIGGAIGWRWQILVYDESSRLKGFVRRTPAVKYKDGKKIKVKPQLTEFGVLAQARKLVKRVVELSGTPSPNGLIDLGGQAFLIDQGERLKPTRAQFLEEWFDENQFSREIKPKPHAEREIMGRMKDIMIGLRAEDYIDLPPRHFNVIKVKLQPKILQQYREFERTMVAEEYDVEALSRGVLVNKLLQFASGGLYRSDPDVYPAVRETIAVHDAKLKALDNIVEEAAGQSVLIAYCFQFDKERIRKRFPKAVFFDEDKNFVKNWNAGKIKIGVAHPACLHPSTEVLTQHRGWLRITDVTPQDKVFDGVEFVTHGGCHYSGQKQIKEVFGIKMTPDHKLLINNKWICASDVETVESAREKARYTYSGNDVSIGKMFAMRGDNRNRRAKFQEAQSKEKRALPRLYLRHFPQHDSFKNMGSVEGHESPRPRQRGQKLRWPRHRNIGIMDELSKLLRRYGADLQREFEYREGRRERRVLQRKLHLDDTLRAAVEQTDKSDIHLCGEGDASRGTLQFNRGEQSEVDVQIGQRDGCGGSDKGRSEFDIWKRTERDWCQAEENEEGGEYSVIETSDVYDLVDCGPRHRFLIRNAEGEVFVSHNSIGHGLNLQHGGHIQVWYGLTWSLELWDQFNRRLARPGQKNPTVFIHVIVAEGTADEDVLHVLKTKGVTQDQITQAVRVRLGVSDNFTTKLSIAI